MKWTKRGLVFEATGAHLPGGAVGFAQAPQALVCEDRVRVFFSTRRVDAGNKYLSDVAYADFDRGMARVLGTSGAPVMVPGGLGCFDEHGIFPLHVHRHGRMVLGYTTGWSRRTAVSIETAIGLALSDDEGRTFRRTGPGPILGPSLHEPFLVGDPFVLRDESAWHMWYIFGTRWLAPGRGCEAPERVYKIAHASSMDGVTWQRNGRALIPDRLGHDECQALPTVIRLGARYHMVFCYREATGFRRDPARGYRLGYAHSADGLSWVRADEHVGLAGTRGAWDSDMQCYPHLFQCDGRVYMLYNGNEFGRHGFGLAVLDEID